MLVLRALSIDVYEHASDSCVKKTAARSEAAYSFIVLLYRVIMIIIVTCFITIL